MTRTELEELSQRIASEMPCINNHIELKQDGYVIYTEEELGNFAHALLVEIQKKLEVHPASEYCGTLITTLPIIEE